MQSSVGTLIFFCKAIRSSRGFNRRIHDSICGCFKLHYHIRLSVESKVTLRFGLFLKSFNEITYFPKTDKCELSILDFFNDSAGSIDLGCGAYFQGRLFFLPWHNIGRIRIL